MQVRMKLCQSKQVDLLFSESLLRILTLKKCCPHFYPPSALTSISLFFYQIIHEVGGSEPPTPPPPDPLPPTPPWKIFFIRACYAFCIKAGRNYDKRTNRRTFDPINNRCHDVPFRPGLKQWDRRYIAFVADTALRNINLKADMKSYIPLETAAIFFLANLFPRQGISSEYVTADFICMGLLGLQGAKTANYKMKNSCPYRDSNPRPLILKSSALSMRLSCLILVYKR